MSYPLINGRDTVKYRYPQQVLGNAHQQQLRQPLYEEAPDPGRHLVGARLAVVDVQDDNRDDDTQSDQQHGEQEVLAKKWQGERR